MYIMCVVMSYNKMVPNEMIFVHVHKNRKHKMQCCYTNRPLLIITIIIIRTLCVKWMNIASCGGSFTISSSENRQKFFSAELCLIVLQRKRIK